MLSSDGGEIGKSHAVDIGIISDVGLFCDAFVAKASSAGFPRNEDWIKKCFALNNSPSPFEKDEKVMPDGQLHVSPEPQAVRSPVGNNLTMTALSRITSSHDESTKRFYHHVRRRRGRSMGCDDCRALPASRGHELYRLLGLFG